VKPDPHEFSSAHEQTRAAWNANAAYWDERMGEGNDFVESLIWPSAQRMLALQPGERVLDIACGNGLYARKMAALGAEVVAFDFADEMIARAAAHPAPPAGSIGYRALDGTDEAALLALGERSFDAAACMMALFDMAEIGPLMRGAARLLRPGGRFVFSILHPCFNSSYVVRSADEEDREGTIVTSYWLKLRGYMTSRAVRGLALRNQPEPHVYFDRPLQDVLGAGFAAGFVVDDMEERAFPADQPHGRNPLSWGSHYSEFPPVLVARMIARAWASASASRHLSYGGG
jgi:2-polyprenyl-3-methyl-5-hydroxy-6-metoxy-1,4-benzoquinol methylase